MKFINSKKEYLQSIIFWYRIKMPNNGKIKVESF